MLLTAVWGGGASGGGERAVKKQIVYFILKEISPIWYCFSKAKEERVLRSFW